MVSSVGIARHSARYEHHAMNRTGEVDLSPLVNTTSDPAKHTVGNPIGDWYGSKKGLRGRLRTTCRPSLCDA